MLDNALQVRIALCGAEVQSELRQLDRNLTVQAARVNLIQQRNVLVGGAHRSRGLVDVFSRMREDGANTKRDHGKEEVE